MNATTAQRAESPKTKPSASYRLERRRAERRVITGRVTAVARPPHPGPAHGRICSLQLLNLSETGVGLLSQEPVELNSLVTVFFPAQGAQRGRDATGRVVRCTPRARGFGHEVGIHFEARVAA
ncbi:MAG: PilZ domain-containing protein [Planctomycetota bacterium]|nr:PilZ domain-containing protein [Planctomycetota bacterium]